MNTTKIIYKVFKNPEENHKFPNLSSNLRELDIQRVLMVYFRWTLPSPSVSVYSPSRWNATQCLLEPFVLFLHLEIIM